MSSLLSTLAAALLAMLALLLSACDSQPPEAGKSSRDKLPLNYTQYRNNGVSFSHPDSWNINFDDKPGIYADREIGLNVSDVSTFRVMIMDEERSLQSAADLFERQLRLNESESISGYKRMSFAVNGLPAKRLTWTQTMLNKSNFELTIIDLPVQSGSAFAVYQLVEDDIEEFEKDKALTAQSITIN
ncbi:hypothetical protein [Marinimicrobium locisalis]|uniref:hypothetical protein n=1 Tax=Marinimicrobium locisalis TaxID=546022 RepID=UPI0032216899